MLQTVAKGTWKGMKSTVEEPTETSTAVQIL